MIISLGQGGKRILQKGYFVGYEDHRMPSTLLGQISCHEDFGLLLKRNFPTIPSFLVEQKTRLLHGKAKRTQQGNLLGFIPP